MEKQLIIIGVISFITMNLLLVLAMCITARKADNSINEIRNK